MREIFDKVKTHLLAQGERALEGSMCVYHAQSGLKCAVGCLITEEAYIEALEGDTIDTADDLGLRAALEASGISLDRTTINMLFRLQSIHDNVYPPDWVNELDNLEADIFGDAE